MRIEDALLGIRMCAGTAPGEDRPAWCRRAIEGGVDLLQFDVPDGGSPASHASSLGVLVEVCHENDALLVVSDYPDLAARSGADGVLLTGRRPVSVGMARSILGNGALLGMVSHSIEDANVALEVGADYLLHYGGEQGASAFRGAFDFSGFPVYAAGVGDVGLARDIVQGGHHRICLASEALKAGSVTQDAIEFSRALGRCF